MKHKQYGTEGNHVEVGDGQPVARQPFMRFWQAGYGTRSRKVLVSITVASFGVYLFVGLVLMHNHQTDLPSHAQVPTSTVCATASSDTNSGAVSSGAATHATNGQATVADLSVMLSHYGQAYSACDLNGDGTVNVQDLSILLNHYGT